MLRQLKSEIESSMDKRKLPRENEIWNHFKNRQYKIIAIAQHTETGEQCVVYQALYGDRKNYIRPLDMFMSKVDKVKYPHAVQKYRFEIKESCEKINKKTIDLI